MNKDVEQHLNELIEFYSQTDINDIDYIKKLFIRNLKDVKNRYIKYDKPIKQRIDKAIEYIKKVTRYSCISGIVEFFGNTDDVITILQGGEIDE